ncbi:MAG: prepilin peptidase [Candidatus Cloacimonas sp.]
MIISIGNGREYPLLVFVIILIAVLSTALGSFFNVLISRIPKKQSIVFPGSHCESCKKSIPFYQNIPIISYLLLGGKCSNCGAKIHWHHLVVEIITPLLFLGLFFRYGLHDFRFYKYILLCSFLIPIFFIDAFHQIIPHVLSIPLLISGVILAVIPGNDVGILNSLLTAAFVFGLLLLLAWAYQKIRGVEGLGGGDIWLLTALAVFFGVTGIPYIFLLSAIMGIIYFLIFVKDKRQPFAFGTFIAVAAILWALVGEETVFGFLRFL